MNDSRTYQALNRLLTILNRSLPAYLINTSPWRRRAEEDAWQSVRRIAEDELAIAGRAAEYVIEHYGPPELGEYPIDFYDTHDLSLDYLLKKLVRYQKKDVASLERVVAGLAHDRQAAVLAEEALGAGKGHLETLEELAAQPARS